MTFVPIDFNTIILSIIALAGTITPILLTFMKKDISSTKATGEATHIAVNSERTAMMAELKALHQTIKEQSAIVGGLTEKIRGQEVVTAAAAAAAAAPAVPAAPILVTLVTPPQETGR